MALQFSHCCGKNIAVKDGGLVVEKIFGSGYAAAFTNRPLRTSERFEVEVIAMRGYPSLSLGITTWSPEEVEIPQYMRELTPSWMMSLVGLTGGHMEVNGTSVQDVLSRDEVMALKKDDKLALMVTPERELIFFLNGRQIGTGTATTSGAVFAFCEECGLQGDSVRLIPDLREEERHQLAMCNKMIQTQGKITITLLNAMFSGPPRVGKSTMLSRLFELKPSPPALPQQPTAVTTENPSTGVAEKVLQVTVKPSTTLLGRASGPGMKWELQTLDSEAIALLKAIVSTVQDEASSSSASELPSASSSAADSNLEQSKPVSKKLAELITAFKQRIMRQPKTKQPPLPTADHGSPEVSRGDEKSGATATIPGLKLPDELFREAFRSSQKETIQALLEGCFTIYLTDTGGQPEFQELLAALIAGPSVFFLVFNLTSSLNDKYVVEYVRPGSKVQPYVSSFTTKEVLLQSLASIACTCSHVRQGNDEMKPIATKVVLVGTHKDIASPEQIEAIQKELKQALEETDYHRQNMIVYASRDEPVVTVNNLDPEGKDICKVRAIIEKIAEDPAFQVSIPFPMLVLSLILRGLSDPVLSYQQCRSIADECGIKTSQGLNAALWFLHTKLGVVRYFPHIRELREIVIRDPQIIFDRITDLISSTFTFEMTGQYREQQFQQTGIFTLNEIERLTATVDKLFTPARLIKLLEYLHIIAPIRDERGRVVEFFLPCVLTHALSSPPTVATDQPIPSLLVTFRCGYCPKGMFSALVVHLLTSNNTTRSSWQLKKDGMARGQVTFHAGDEYNMVTVTTHVTHLEVSVQPTHFPGRKYGKNLHTICSTIRESIDEGIVSVCKTLRYSCDAAFSFGFLCYHSSCGTSKSHAANIQDEKKPRVSICSKMGSVEGLSPYHHLWFGEKLDRASIAALEKSGLPQSQTASVQTQLSPRSHSLQQQSDGQQSEEYRKLQLNLDTATNYLAANIDPELLATKLLAAGMINRSLVEEAGMNTTAKSKRIRALMYAVLSLVELNSEKYGQFLDILEDMEGLDELVHLLQ